MDVLRSVPALPAAFCWLAGLLWAYELGPPPVHLAALGLACSLAWSGRQGALPLIAFFAALLVAAGETGRERDPLLGLAGKSVEVRGRALGHADGEGERVFLLESESLRAGERVYPVAPDLLVVLGRETSESEHEIEWGDRLILRGLLQAPLPPRNGTAGWPGLYRLRVKSDKLAEISGKGSVIDRWAAVLRRGAGRALDAWPADPRAAGLLKCLLLGDRSDLPESWARAFNAIGLGHALSVSGFHIGLFFLMVWGLTSLFPYRLRWLRLLLVFAVLTAYLLLVGPRPAALRAGIMGLAVLAALIFERPAMALNSLAIAAILLTFDRPQLVVDLSFQLSVLATFGIAVSALLTDERTAPWRRWIGAGLAAELMTLPLLLPRTGVWHPLGFAWNIVAGPWLGALIALGLLYLVAAAFLPPARFALAQLFAAGCVPLDWLERLLPSPLFTLPILTPGIAGFLVPMVALAWLPFPQQTRWALLLGLLFIVDGAPFRPAERLEVAFIDVGQGDATLLIDGRRALLVDGGGWRRGDPAARQLIPALVKLGIPRLSAVALSHGDLDHCGGVDALGFYFPLGELWASEETAETACGKSVEQRSSRFRKLAAGDRLVFGRWQLEVLWPSADRDPRAAGNEGSLVLKATAGGASLLLTGDIEKTTEGRLVYAKRTALRAEVLKVAHHGSRTSSTSAFLAAARARWAVVSAGAGNSFGHPAPEVLERLSREGHCRILRTDRQGLVRLHWPQAGRPMRLELGGMPIAAYRMPR